MRPLGRILLTLNPALLCGCGWNERTIVHFKLEPVHFLNADTLHYVETRKSETQKCALFSGCETVSNSKKDSDRCYSVKQNRSVSCPPLQKLSFPKALDSVEWNGQKVRLIGFIEKDNKSLGFASAFFDAPNSGRMKRMSYLYMARPDDTHWRRIAGEDTCMPLGTLGDEARFYETWDFCSDPTGSQSMIQFLGTHPDTTFIGAPVSRIRVPEYLLNGVLATDSSKYARWIFPGGSAEREAIGFFSPEGAPIDTLLGPKQK